MVPNPQYLLSPEASAARWIAIVVIDSITGLRRIVVGGKNVSLSTGIVPFVARRNDSHVVLELESHPMCKSVPVR